MTFNNWTLITLQVSAITGGFAPSMPILEDGLSSGHVSESDDDGICSSPVPLPEALTTLLMRKQISEIEREVADKINSQDRQSVESQDRQSDDPVNDVSRQHVYQNHYTQHSYPQVKQMFLPVNESNGDESFWQKITWLQKLQNCFEINHRRNYCLQSRLYGKLLNTQKMVMVDKLRRFHLKNLFLLLHITVFSLPCRLISLHCSSYCPC